MHEDHKLKKLSQSIARKEVAKNEADSAVQSLEFDMEISELMDEFEARCVLLLKAALERNDSMAVSQFFGMVQFAAGTELIANVYTNLFKILIRHVVHELSPEAKDEVIARLRTYLE